MPFFIRDKVKGNRSVGQKRKGAQTKHGSKTTKEAPKPKKNRRVEDEEISSDSDIDDRSATHVEVESDEEDKETAQEKRLRLAKEYVSQIEAQEEEREEDDGEDLIAQRLKQDLLEQSGKLHKQIADTILEPTQDDICILRGHQLPLTCLVITPDDQHIFTASKDCSIIKWNIETGRKEKVLPGGRKGTEKKHIGHTSHVLCMAISSDGEFLVSGDQNKNIMVWNPGTCERRHVLTGHRDAVSGLAFRKGTHTLFSASHDRSVKIWDLDEMAYVETLYGHQDAITAIDSLTRDRALTSGGRDGSLRIWKVLEESQLVFHGHSGSIDCVALINEENFISGADDNSLALWTVMKKKPLVRKTNAHGNTPDGSTGGHDNWVTAVASLQQSDLVASGSKDGCIRLWKCGPGFKALTPVVSIPMVGFVNSLRFSSTGSFLVAGVGQEHRLGRWWRMREARNCVAVIRLHRKDST